jgi:hypothetical protein
MTHDLHAVREQLKARYPNRTVAVHVGAWWHENSKNFKTDWCVSVFMDGPIHGCYQGSGPTPAAAMADVARQIPVSTDQTADDNATVEEAVQA